MAAMPLAKHLWKLTNQTVGDRLGNYSTFTDLFILNNSQALGPLTENVGFEGIFIDKNIALWMKIQSTSSAARKFEGA